MEFDFLPNGLSENQMHALLLFMALLGDLVGKPVVMTPENAQHLPIYEYQPSTRRMRWIASTG